MHPAQTGAQAPRGEDWFVRELSRIEREQREATASVARSFETTVAALTAQQTLLAATVAAMPVSAAGTVTTAGWAATNNGVVASDTIPWVAGKSKVDVVANMQGFYEADYAVPNSDRPAFRIHISGAASHPMAQVPGNMDTYWLVGSSARRVSLAVSAVTVNLVTTAGPAMTPAYAENDAYLGVLAIFS